MPEKKTIFHTIPHSSIAFSKKTTPLHLGLAEAGQTQGRKLASPLAYLFFDSPKVKARAATRTQPLMKSCQK